MLRARETHAVDNRSGLTRRTRWKETAEGWVQAAVTVGVGQLLDGFVDGAPGGALGNAAGRPAQGEVGEGVGGLVEFVAYVALEPADVDASGVREELFEKAAAFGEEQGPVCGAGRSLGEGRLEACDGLLAVAQNDDLRVVVRVQGRERRSTDADDLGFAAVGCHGDAEAGGAVLGGPAVSAHGGVVPESGVGDHDADTERQVGEERVPVVGFGKGRSRVHVLRNRRNVLLPASFGGAAKSSVSASAVWHRGQFAGRSGHPT